MQLKQLKRVKSVRSALVTLVEKGPSIITLGSEPTSGSIPIVKKQMASRIRISNGGSRGKPCMYTRAIFTDCPIQGGMNLKRNNLFLLCEDGDQPRRCSWKKQLTTRQGGESNKSIYVFWKLLLLLTGDKKKSHKRRDFDILMCCRVWSGLGEGFVDWWWGGLMSISWFISGWSKEKLDKGTHRSFDSRINC